MSSCARVGSQRMASIAEIAAKFPFRGFKSVWLSSVLTAARAKLANNGDASAASVAVSDDLFLPEVGHHQQRHHRACRPEDGAGPIAAAEDADPARPQPEAFRQAADVGHGANLIGAPQESFVEHAGSLSPAD